MVNIVLLLFIISNSTVRELGNKGIEISFTMDKLDRQNYSFSEAVWLNNEGEPNLPSLLYKIGIPQDSDVEITIIENREDILKNVAIEPVIYPGIYEPPFPEAVEIHGDVYKENRYFPQNLIEISKPAYFRDIYTVEVKLNPMQYNPVSKELRILKNVKINIRFKGEPRIKPITDKSFEEIYKRTIVNYEQCKKWRREPKRDSRNPFALGVWFKIEVDEEGIYRIGYDEIVDAGLDPGQFDPKTMKIYTAAFDLLPIDVVATFEDSLIEIPVYVEGEDDYSFDENDYLIFYGYPGSHFTPDSEVAWFENGYARDNAYWFTFGGDYGERMEMVDASWNGGTSDTLVNEILHIEEDISNPTRSGINWYWQDMSPGDGPSGSGSINVEHLKANGNAKITISIFTLHAGEFLYQFSLGGQIYFSDTLYLVKHDSWPPHYLTGDAVLLTDSSELTIDIIRPSGTTGQLTAYLNCVDIQYERLTDMNQPFHAFYKEQVEYSIKCTNVGSTPFVLDITDIGKPKMFYNYTINNNSMMLSNSSDTFQLLYFSKLSLAKPANLISTNPGNLRTQSEGCEYLVIVHKDFYNAIMPLVDYRRREYTSKVVTVGDVFNDFSFGKYDPLAIKHFLYYTTNNWTTIPKYIFLVGDATYDYKNNLGKENPPNFVPMYEDGTMLTGNPGIPPWQNSIYEGEYVNFGGGEAMVLGRITVRTTQEVRDFIDKLITYETQNIDGMWNKRIILAGDDEYATGWEGIEHCYSCEAIIQHIPDSLYDLAKIYMVSYPPFTYPTTKPNAKKAFVRDLNKGGYAGVYYGHGNTHQLAHEGLFYDTSIPKIKNGRRYFFYYFGSCTVGRFDDSDYECIGEQLVRMKGGAIGTMAETAGSYSGTNRIIGNTLFNLLTTTDLTMGECFNIAKQGEYLLIGEPATKMRRITENMMIEALPESLVPMDTLNITTDESSYYLKAFIRDTTHIDRFDVSTTDKISGHIKRDVQSGPSSWTTFDYEIDGKEIYQGFWDEDTAGIIAPRIITTHEPVIKLSSFVNKKSGVLDSIRVYGTASPSDDDIGPEVILYDGARKLKDGDWVDKKFTLTGKVSDESGINLLHSIENVDRGFYLYLNHDTQNKIDLRDYFMYDRNSYTTGEFHVEIILPEPVDTITINAADNYYNQTTKKVVINAEMYDDVEITNFLIYPNPLQDDNSIWFTFNLSNSGLVDIKIFTIAGRLIKTINNVSCGVGYNQINWATLDQYGAEISNGIYLVKAFVHVDNYNDEVIEKFVIAR